MFQEKTGELVEIGRILKPFGVKGELKVQLYIDDESDLKKVSSFFIKDRKNFSGYRELHVKNLQYTEQLGFAKVVFEEIGDRTVAEAWRLVPLYIDRSCINAPQEGEFFIQDLLDLDVWYNKENIGKVFNLIEVANQSIFVIRQTSSKMDLAVPFTDRYVREVLIHEGKIIFDHLDELL